MILNEKWKPIIDLRNGYVILSNEKRKEYNLASYYNADDNTWARGHYYFSVDDCLACYLRLKNHRLIKSDRQLNNEFVNGIEYDRLNEIASECLDIVKSGYSYSREELIDGFDFTTKEIKYFALDEEEEWDE